MLIQGFYLYSWPVVTYVKELDLFVQMNRTPPSPIESQDLRRNYFVLIVPHWFAKTYAKEFATRDYHLVLEVITLMVRNIVESVRFNCIMIDCFVLAVVCS
jgi:hypothetical protein